MSVTVSAARPLITDRGPVRVELPRDRDGSFDPILIPKHERRFTGFDERIIAMYARGMSVREIQAFLAESYGTEVSPDFISSVTDEVMAEARAVEHRPDASRSKRAAAPLIRSSPAAWASFPFCDRHLS
ncbi:hypothetical protein N234_32450 [Ralstonia pickettii DTP0602]|nr:hypothetical protein N234_32450 [Ralstonia pickettii DTP0602]